jgi:hypothetical protein
LLKGTRVATPRGNFFSNACKEVMAPKLLIPIASNKSEQKSKKNLETMIGATKAQFFK